VKAVVKRAEELKGEFDQLVENLRYKHRKRAEELEREFDRLVQDLRFYTHIRESEREAVSQLKQLIAELENRLKLKESVLRDLVEKIEDRLELLERTVAWGDEGVKW
jgi:predicted RecB family endonuclease